MTGWERVKCKIGLHDWGTVKENRCNVYKSNLFTTVKDIPGIAKIEECRRCPSQRGVVSDGIVSQVFPAQYLIKRGFIL